MPTPAGPHVALIGCGNWGRNILRDLLELGCMVSVAEHNEAHRKAAHERGATRVVADPTELPATVDGIIVAVPTTRHAGVIEAELHRGVPIFTEKPLTSNLASARKLAAAAPDRLFVMDKWRYHPGIEALRDIASSRELGPVNGLRLTQVGWASPHWDEDVVWHIAPHGLAMMLEILGEIPPVTHTVADFDGAGRAVGIVATFGTRPWAVLEVSARYADHIRHFRLHASDGVAALNDALADHLKIMRGATTPHSMPEIEHRPIATEWPLIRELRAFVSFIAGGPPPKSSVAEGVRIVEAIVSMRQMAGIVDNPS